MSTKSLLFPTLFVVLVLMSCDCNDCEPLQSEPKVKVRFFEKSTLSLDTVFIESVNEIGYQDIRYFGDSADLFYFPLNISANTSSFEVSYRSIKNWDSLRTDSFTIDYSIATARNEENITRFEAIDIEAVQYSFDSVAVACQNSECIDENTTIKLYR